MKIDELIGKLIDEPNEIPVIVLIVWLRSLTEILRRKGVLVQQEEDEICRVIEGILKPEEK